MNRRVPKKVAAAIAIAGAMGLVTPAQAESRVDIGGATQVRSDCGPFDPDCRDYLRTILVGLHLAQVQAEGAVTFGADTTTGDGSHFGGVGAVGFKLLAMDYESGDVEALVFDLAYISESSVRLRFTLADTEVLFMCKSEGGDVVAPILTKFSKCEPGGAWAYVGAGAELVRIQWDAATERVAARWAQIQAVINLLGNANAESYLHQRLQAYAGMSVDTIWYGDVPGKPADAGKSVTIPRGNFGISGMIRSNNNRWEIRGLAGYRPNFMNWLDFSIETRLQGIYHMLIGTDNMLDFGLDAQYQYNSVPSHSIGTFASDRSKHSAFLGALVGFTWQ